MPRTTRGTVIAKRYAVVRPLGRGGMGKVYLVKDRTNGQWLALKVLRSKYRQNKQAIARFEREVNSVRSLDHPGIVKILDARLDKAPLYYTMEYIEGKSLRKWLMQRRRLAFGSVVRVLCLVADALEHAHRVTIHRDISPENIMVLPNGSVRVCDFGLAKLEDTHHNLTMIGAAMGKVQYNAPEQQRDASKVDHRADIYPLGVMFFEMLVGRLPKGRERIFKYRPDLPPECDAFLRKAMAPDPDERFRSALEFRKALHRLYTLYETSQEEAVEAAPLPEPRPRRWYERWNPLALLRRQRSAK